MRVIQKQFVFSFYVFIYEIISKTYLSINRPHFVKLSDVTDLSLVQETLPSAMPGRTFSTSPRLPHGSQARAYT